MAACARAPLASPRIVREVAASPHVRLRNWEAEAGEVGPARPSAHATVELTWLDDGEIGYGIGARRFDVPAGTAMLVPSAVEHATSFPSRMRGAALWIERHVVEEIGDAMGAKGGPAIGLVPDGVRIAKLGAILSEESKQAEPGALMAVDAIAEAMLAIALRCSDRKNENGNEARVPRDPSIAAAVRYIESAYAEALTVEGMARAAAMSRYHFSRRFRDATGRSPYRYLVDVRLERAAELLRRGRCDVLEAALTVGFTDSSRFARMFRRRFGASPSQWASAKRAPVLYAV